VAIEAGRGEVWVEKVKVRTTAPVSKDGVRHIPDGAIGELTALFAEARSDPERLVEVDFDFSDVVKKLPSELKDAVRSEDPGWLQSVLTEAESRLVSQLLESEEAE
jgi:hypothetical protein